MVQLRTLFVLLVGLFVTGAAQAQAVTDVGTLLDLLKSSPTPGYVEIESFDPVSSMAVEDQQGYMLEHCGVP